jgi:hypothetical protein
MVAAAAVFALAVLFTWGWDLTVATGHESAATTRRIAVCTSALSLLGGLLLLRSGRSLSGELLTHQRRARVTDAVRVDRQAERNRRFIATCAGVLTISGLAGLLLALAH